ncbi:metallopeptidase TldD-related protein [Ectopseudomonas hydrolytica]|uniref:Metallopeptidase TldD-related protein n=1 Tax=Ectopseudomonas hydrolytica TaxID=2493633 RepID=A0ABY5AC40_9GAMM|nr:MULTISPECIES: metallopeptidase TldD-related protein [Pseudomonas]MDH0097902.1 metallopeptidase TldD-related protein [Pseudomonas sp. GD04158]USR40594.1 metallopeptidase TldD-related protein [Pseudomonas hydrolytica]
MNARQHFCELLAHLQAQVAGEEGFTLAYSAEQSGFVRFNHGRVRQAGQVQQSYVTLALYQSQRHAESRLALGGTLEEDLPRLQQALQQLRAVLPTLNDDPYLRLNREAWRSELAVEASLPDSAAMAQQIVSAASGLDLVGFLAVGPQYQGFASSWGAFGWYAASSFNLEFSLFHDNGQAVKSAYAGEQWDVQAFARKLEDARQQLAYLGRPAKALQPGAYRAYLAPAALEELISLCCWGFGAQALASGGSPLQRLFSGKAELSSQVVIEERIEGGLAPAFTAEGPRQALRLVSQGRPGERLVSSRSAAEYGLIANGACSGEYPLSLRMHGGELDEQDVLQRLGSGLYIGNLWYGNFSDLPAARLTGMTRFATFWIEDGQIQAPVNTMRFDDSLFDVLGAQLEALTREPELLLPGGTYGARQTGSMALPGALLSRFTLTL